MGAKILIPPFKEEVEAGDSLVSEVSLVYIVFWASQSYIVRPCHKIDFEPVMISYIVTFWPLPFLVYFFPSHLLGHRFSAYVNA